MKALACLALFALLSGCIPIGVRGTSIVDGGTARPGAAAGWQTAASPAAHDPHPLRAGRAPSSTMASARSAWRLA